MALEHGFVRQIFDQPDVLRRSLQHNDAATRALARRWAGKVDRVVLVGCGDPYMHAVNAAYAFEEWAGIPAESLEAAEFALYRYKLVNEHTLVVLITSSGKTVKVIDAARLCRPLGAQMVAVTNAAEGPITKEVEHILLTQAGKSEGFPTKQSTTALAVILQLVLALAEESGKLPPAEVTRLRRELYEDVPKAVEEALKLDAQMKDLAQKLPDESIYTFIGSGPDYATALIAAAKMKEICNSRSQASNLEEFGHLFQFSMHKQDTFFLITRSDILSARNRMMSQHITVHKGKQVVLGPASEKAAWAGHDVTFVTIPDHNPLFSVLVAWVPLQLFAYYVSIGKGRNPDGPPPDWNDELVQRIIYTSLVTE